MKTHLACLGLAIVSVLLAGCADSVTSPAGSPPDHAAAWREAGVSPLAADALQFEDLTLVGDARITGTGVLRLTRNLGSLRGAAWMTAKQRVSRGFITTFRFRISPRSTSPDVGSDGLAFVVQDESVTAIGSGGGGIGYGTLDAVPGIRRSLAVEIDTFQNFEFPEPNGNHIAVHTRGIEPNSPAPDGMLALFSPSVNLSNAAVHTLTVRYVPGQLTVFLDAIRDPVLTVPVNLTNINGASILDAQGRAWVGFTAATGGRAEYHDIRLWQFATLPN
jgi:hypothetical protein